MCTVLFTFDFFLPVTLDMSIGYVFSKRTIEGSCDDTSSLGMKKVCDCEAPCDMLQKRLDKQDAVKNISVGR